METSHVQTPFATSLFYLLPPSSEKRERNKSEIHRNNDTTHPLHPTQQWKAIISGFGLAYLHKECYYMSMELLAIIDTVVIGHKTIFFFQSKLLKMR